MLALGKRSRTHEEETSGDSTPNTTHFLLVLLYMPGPCTSVCLPTTASACCIAPCQRVQRLCSRLLPPIGMLASWLARVFLPGIGAPPSVPVRGWLWGWARRSPCK